MNTQPPCVGVATARAVCVMGLAGLVMTCLAFGAPLQHGFELPDGADPGIVVLCVHWALTLFGLVMLGAMPSKPRPLQIACRTVASIDGVILLTALVMMAPYRDQLGPTGWAPGYWALPWVLWLLSILPTRTYLPLGLGIVASLAGLASIPPASGAPVVLNEAVWTAEPLLIAIVLVGGLMHAGQLRDQTRSMQLDARRAIVEETNAGLGRLEAARLLQDHLLHALHAMSLPGPDVTREMVETECRDTIAAVEAVGDGRARLDIATLLEKEPRLAQAEIHHSGGQEAAPAIAARALSEAAGCCAESLASRGMGPSWVQMHQDEQRWTVQVTAARPVKDDQPDPAEGPTARYLAAIGGESQSGFDEQGRHQVTFVWPAEERPSLAQWRTPVDETTRRMLPLSAVPGFAVSVLNALAAWSGLPNPFAFAAVIAVLACLGSWWMMDLRRESPRPLMIAAMLLVTVGCWAVGVQLWPEGWDGLAQMSLIGGCNAIVMLAILQVRPVVGTAISLGWAVVLDRGIRWRHGASGVWELAIGNIAASVGTLLMVVLTLTTVRFLVANRGGQSLGRHIEEATAMIHRGIEPEQHWSQTVTQSVLPTLHAVAEGRLDPRTPEMVAQARLWALSTRDELAIGPGHPNLVHQLTVRRESGWELGTTVAPSVPAAVLDLMTTLLAALGEPAHRGQRARMSVSAQKASIVALEATGEQRDHWSRQMDELGGVWIEDEDFCQLALTAPSRARAGEDDTPCPLPS